MKKISLIFVVIFFATFSFSQSINNELTSNAGNTGEDSNGNTLSWSVGEVLTQTYSSDNNKLTQGFHQGILTFVNINEKQELDFTINIYPNPTTNILTIDISKLPDNETLKVKILDINGKLINERMLDLSNTIDFRNYAKGTYLISIHNSKNEIIKTGKIIKSE